MRNIVLTVESGSDMPRDLAEQYGIHVVPMHITFGTHTRKDGSFPVSDICDYYAKTKAIPKTSGSSPGDFMAAFAQIRRDCPGRGILHLAYSAVTTCSYQSAVLAAGESDDIICVDTKQVAVGQTAVAIRVAQELERHPEWTLREAAQCARRIADSVNMSGLPKDLSFLRAGGRVSNAAALLGSLLDIHPVIDLKNGYLVAGRKFRGKMHRIIPKFIEAFVHAKRMDRRTIWLEYTVGLSDELKRLAEDTVRKLGFQAVRWIEAGGVITTHGGPGALAIAGYAAGE